MVFFFFFICLTAVLQIKKNLYKLYLCDFLHEKKSLVYKLNLMSSSHLFFTGMSVVVQISAL